MVSDWYVTSIKSIWGLYNLFATVIVLVVKELQRDLIASDLPQAPYYLFVYDFPYGFSGIVGYLRATAYVFTFIRPSCNFFDGFPQWTGAKP